MHESYVTVEGVFAQIDCSDGCRPSLMRCHLWHQGHAKPVCDQPHDGFQFVHFAHLV
ncbi:hypothetical protein B0G57_10160 [Trinickia symbiotica]|nr:hypothetical protein B0G57_10160 [Trinickia symbiotica]